jgi:hypothetical protein
MRILIVGSQKSGNVWLMCLLAHAHDLRILVDGEKPQRPPGLGTFHEWLARGGFPDGTIFHHHYRYSPELADAISNVPAHIVTIVRDPYDAFVSYYYAVQRRVGRGFERDALIGKPLDHPDVLQYLRDGSYRQTLKLPRGWITSRRTPVIRYEDLHQDPIGALARLNQHLGSVSQEKLERVVRACSAENMREMEFVRPGHIRAAKVGDSRDQLDESHLAIFRDHYAKLIRSLGYEVR